MHEANALKLLCVLGNIGVSDKAPVRLRTTTSIDCIVSWILANHLLDEAVEYVPPKSHHWFGAVWLEVMLVQVEFILDEHGNRGVVEIGKKVIENEVSLALVTVGSGDTPRARQ